MFQQSSALVLNKIDLLPHTNADLSKMKADARALNPKLAVFEVSCRTGAGVDTWAQWLIGLRSR
jgi:hydrogenase nickel incorporation protein HypB